MIPVPRVRWPPRPCSSPVPPAASGRRPRWGWLGWARMSLSPVETRNAVRGRQPTSRRPVVSPRRSSSRILSSQAEVRRLADEVRDRLPRLDVLVNNVGGYWSTRHVTVDGLERTFALNHL